MSYTQDFANMTFPWTRAEIAQAFSETANGDYSTEAGVYPAGSIGEKIQNDTISNAAAIASLQSQITAIKNQLDSGSPSFPGYTSHISLGSYTPTVGQVVVVTAPVLTGGTPATVSNERYEVIIAGAVVASFAKTGATDNLTIQQAWASSTGFVRWRADHAAGGMVDDSPTFTVGAAASLQITCPPTFNAQVGTPVTPTQFGIASGWSSLPLVFSISPDLTALTGLAFDTAGAWVTGTPTASLAATQFEVTVTDASSNVTSGFVTVTVAAQPTASIDPSTDPRVVGYTDGDRTFANHPTFNKTGGVMWIQMHKATDGAVPASNSGESWYPTLPYYTNVFGPNGYKHTDGSVWVKREARNDGKQAMTLRAMSTDLRYNNDSYRAELAYEYDDNGAWDASMIWEDPSNPFGTTTYWIGIDWMFDADEMADPEMQVSSHEYSWAADPTYESHGAGHSIVHAKAPGAMDGLASIWWVQATGTTDTGSTAAVYDVRTTPFSPTDVGSAWWGPGGQWGNTYTWRLMNTAANTSYKVIAHLKVHLTDGFLRIWTKAGTGALTKRVDYTGPTNIYNGSILGARYWKFGEYGNTGMSGVRTTHVRSDIYMRDVVSSGRPVLDQNVILGWLER